MIRRVLKNRNLLFKSFCCFKNSDLFCNRSIPIQILSLKSGEIQNTIRLDDSPNPLPPSTDHFGLRKPNSCPNLFGQVGCRSLQTRTWDRIV